MRVYVVKAFARFARKEKTADAALVEAIDRAEQGLVDADLGGGVIKQRIARPGAGRSGGYRAIVLFRKGETAIFFYGFAKNERDNIAADELEGARTLASALLDDRHARVAAIAGGALKEVKRG